MKEILLDELKKLQLDMLLTIDDYCEKNNIHYSLEYGSLIGAVRHKGYIPWDDDIDISMPRPDYNKFINSFNGFSDNLTVISPELNWDYFEPYANVYDNRTILFEEDNHHHGMEIGIKIDIFPIDGVPTDYNDYIILSKKLAKLNWVRGYKKRSLKQRLNLILSHPKSIVYEIKHFPYILRTYSSVQKQIYMLSQSIHYENSEYCDNIVFQAYPLKRMRRQSLEDYVKLPFEGHYLNAYSNYDERLKNFYGDYMTLPPEDARVNKHGFHAYWKY